LGLFYKWNRVYEASTPDHAYHARSCYVLQLEISVLINHRSNAGLLRGKKTFVPAIAEKQGDSLVWSMSRHESSQAVGSSWLGLLTTRLELARAFGRGSWKGWSRWLMIDITGNTSAKIRN
jgi:hypothetical protein